MQFTLKMNLDKDAFADKPSWEISRILNRLGNRLIDHPDLSTKLDGKLSLSKGSLHDKNGNRVGNWQIEE